MRKILKLWLNWNLIFLKLNGEKAILFCFFKITNIAITLLIVVYRQYLLHITFDKAAQKFVTFQVFKLKKKT